MKYYSTNKHILLEGVREWDVVELSENGDAKFRPVGEKFDFDGVWFWRSDLEAIDDYVFYPKKEDAEKANLDQIEYRIRILNEVIERTTRERDLLKAKIFK